MPLVFPDGRLLSRRFRWVAWITVVGMIAGSLGGIFLATNLALQAWMAEATGSSTLGVAASTLIVAALFQPLRHAVQVPIDRRFNRARVDAERTVAAFATQTRDEIDLDRLASETRRAAVGALQPATAGVWLRGRRP